jgi:hypothetical protein
MRDRHREHRRVCLSVSHLRAVRHVCGHLPEIPYTRDTEPPPFPPHLLAPSPGSFRSDSLPGGKLRADLKIAGKDLARMWRIHPKIATSRLREGAE